MRLRPFSTETYLRDISAALRRNRLHSSSRSWTAQFKRSILRQTAFSRHKVKRLGLPRSMRDSMCFLLRSSFALARSLLFGFSVIMAWVGFLWLIFWLVSVLPKLDLHDRHLIDPTNPSKGDVRYYADHFWYWGILDGKAQWIDP